MASVTVRIFKSYGSPANHQWLNTYELNDGGPVVEAATDPSLFLTAALAIVNAERLMHYDSIYFNRVTISTWQPDSQPYNPDNLVTVPLGSQGAISVAAGGGEPATLDLRIVLWVARVAAHGKPGRIWYRLPLNEAWIENQGGKIRLSTVFPTSTTFTPYRNALLPYMAGGASSIKLSLIGGTLQKAVVPTTEGGLAHTKIKRTYVSPYHIRTLTDVVLQGATMRQTDNAYFDRP